MCHPRICEILRCHPELCLDVLVLLIPIHHTDLILIEGIQTIERYLSLVVEVLYIGGDA